MLTLIDDPRDIRAVTTEAINHTGKITKHTEEDYKRFKIFFDSL